MVATLGRPRDPTVDGAALEAAVHLIVEDGYGCLTMERIAERARVSKAALYRRWPNKVALVVDAVAASAQESFVPPDTGRVRDDILAFFQNFTRERHTDVEVYDALTGAVESDHELADRCRDMLAAGLVDSFRALIARAVERGELPPGTDVELLADVVPALVRYRRQTTGLGPDAEYIGRIVEQFFQPVRRPLRTPH